ncbi:MAG: hypothetical protein JRC92_03300, partial [Deltaproteobacteria bacterium]|nr:hypothetical protein [Deltaproteobacteria bacterium]
MKTQKGYYVSRKKKLLKDFDKTFARVGRLLSRDYGDGFSKTILEESRQEFEDLIPLIEYHPQPFGKILIIACWQIALYKSLRSHGKTAEDYARIYYQVLTEAYK